MQGAGNDFIVVDEWLNEVVPEGRKPLFVSKVSDRHFGVGSDGVIFVQKSKKADANFVFYNPDGSRAEMCGNGIRCFAKFLYESKLVCRREMNVETLAGVKKILLNVKNGVVAGVTVGMGAPQLKRKEAQVAGRPEEVMVNEQVNIDGLNLRITAVGMGNPHAIIFVDDVDLVDVVSLGRKVRHYNSLFCAPGGGAQKTLGKTEIRHYAKLFPKGINVHFIQQAGPNLFKIRTYERGVEGETLACGTGICASAVAAVLNKKANPAKPLTFQARGGLLEINLKMDGSKIKDVQMTGPAEKVFEGVYEF